MPTKEEYDAAKARQLANERAYAAQKPTEQVLADVAVINAYETAYVEPT